MNNTTLILEERPSRLHEWVLQGDTIIQQVITEWITKEFNNPHK